MALRTVCGCYWTEVLFESLFLRSWSLTCDLKWLVIVIGIDLIYGQGERGIFLCMGDVELGFWIAPWRVSCGSLSEKR